MTFRKLFCIALLALSLAACGGGDNKATATPSSAPAAGTGYPAPVEPAATPTLAAYPTP